MQKHVFRLPMGNAYLPKQQALITSDGESSLSLGQPAPIVEKSSACYSVLSRERCCNPDSWTGTSRGTCINLKQTYVPKHSAPRRASPRNTQRPHIAHRPSSGHRDSLSIFRHDVPPLSSNISSATTSIGASNATGLSHHLCSTKLPITERGKDDDDTQAMLPLTESALRVVSGRYSDMDNAHSINRLGVTSSQFGAFVEAEELLRCKQEAQLLMNRPDVDTHTSLTLNSGNSNAGSISMRGAVGGEDASRSLPGHHRSVTDGGRRSHHPGVRRSLLSTLKQPKKKHPHVSANLVNRQQTPNLRKHLMKIDRLRHSLEQARHCGQLTDVSCELLHQVLQQCSTNADNLLLSQDWRQFLISPSACKAEASTSASSSPTDSPSSQGQYAKVAHDLGSVTSLSEKERWFMNSPLEPENLVVDLDEASDVSDISDYKPSTSAHARSNTLDSDSLWQRDAERRFLDYRRSRLRGRKLGLSCRSPFDAVQEVEQIPRADLERRRELKPLRISREFKDPDSGAVWANVVRDLNMPGFVEDFLKQLSRNGQQDNVRNQAVLLQLLTHLAAERQSSTPAPRQCVNEVAQRHEAIWWDHDTLSVEERQLSNLVYGDQCLMPECTPGISRARRSDARELYRRLVRALDQRVPPQERLLATPNNGMGYRMPVGKPRGVVGSTGTGRRGRQRLRMGEQQDMSPSFRWAPSWIRASRSRQLFGKGSNLFADARYRTRLADLDPERPMSNAC